MAKERRKPDETSILYKGIAVRHVQTAIAPDDDGAPLHTYSWKAVVGDHTLIGATVEEVTRQIDEHLKQRE